MALKSKMKRKMMVKVSKDQARDLTLYVKGEIFRMSKYVRSLTAVPPSLFMMSMKLHSKYKVLLMANAKRM